MIKIILIFVLISIIFFLYLLFKKIDKTPDSKIKNKKNIKKNIICEENQVKINNECQNIKTKKDCQNENEFYIPNKIEKNTTCVEINNNEKVLHCENKNLIFYGNECNKELTLDDCQKENIFLKPNEKTKNTSCIELSDNEKEQYCGNKNLILYENECKKELSLNDCQEESIFHQPDETTNNTSCILMSDDEKKTHCESLNKIFYNNDCIELIPMNLYLDETPCLKGCGNRSIERKHFCIDGYGPDTKKCKDYFKENLNELEWNKLENKTYRFFDKNKSCYDEKSQYYDDFENCHDIKDTKTWDVKKYSRNKYIANENVNCTKTGDLGIIDGNKTHCNWTKKKEVDLNDCDGSFTTTYECRDDNNEIVPDIKCSSQKPPSIVNKGLGCKIKKDKWKNDFITKDNYNKICNSCGILNKTRITRDISCIRKDGKKIPIVECKEKDVVSEKYCLPTNDCNCTCPNGNKIDSLKCNNKYKFKNLNNKSVIDCESCDFQYGLEDYTTEYGVNAKKCVKKFRKRMRGGPPKCNLHLLSQMKHNKSDCTKKCLENDNCYHMCVLGDKCARMKFCTEPKGLTKLALDNINMTCYTKIED